MKVNKITLLTCIVMLAFSMISSIVLANCTIIGVGTGATVDGSTITTHNDDSSGADFRLWIIPEMDWPEGSARDIAVNGHNYIDYGNWPDVEYGDKAIVMEQIPQVEHTYQYFHSRYSFINANGLTMGESTFGQGNSTELGKEVRRILRDESEGIVDCWMAQDIALERAKTAREAVRIMGDLVEEFGWDGSGEIMDISDGDEVWIAEFYGRDIWCAVRVPDDHVFVGANKARIRNIDLDDTENVMHSPNLVSFAVEQGWYDPSSGESFNPADVYNARTEDYWNPREWRVIDLVAPSLGVKPYQVHYPLFVKPDKKLSVHDIFKISGDVYRGTEFDLTQGPGAGPYGDPLSNYRIAGRIRPVGIPLTCYLQIAQTKNWLPDPIKGIVWYGYGAVDSSYITPLWASMEKLPAFYQNGSRYETFRRDSGWWVNTYVQQMVRFRYDEAIQDLYQVRDPKLASTYYQAAAIQEAAAELYKTDPETAVKMISDFAYDTAVGWNNTWLELGDKLMGKYAADRVYMKSPLYPDWWEDWLSQAVKEVEVGE